MSSATLSKGTSQRGQFDRNSSAHLVQPQRSAKTFPAEPKKKEKKTNTNTTEEKKSNWLLCCGSSSDVNQGSHIKHVEVASNLGVVHE
mmetsp:Transcript_20747/g.21401  ORF Transcript_20747/g.21401 Transcript_20747/m.21401 type:complete len:88 (-) Transcript_20747:288-551(-)